MEGDRQGIRERETDTCQRFRTLSSLQRRVIGREPERGRQTHDRDSGHLVAYSGGEWAGNQREGNRHMPEIQDT